MTNPSSTAAAGSTKPRVSNALFHQVLTSARANFGGDSWQITSRDVSGAPSGWSIRKFKLHGGKQEGVDVVEVNNGRLLFLVIPTRGMSVLRVDCGDVRLGWNSPVKEIVHPSFINLEARGGLGWLDGFNEWMVRCGLEFAGHPGQDRFLNNVGAEVTMNVTLHGRIGNTPASEVEVWMESAAPHRLHIRGLVEERAFYGPQLSLWTDISTEPGSTTIRFEDSITNHAAHAHECQLIYHTNFGAPLLQDGSRFFGAVQRVAAFNDRAAEGLAGYDRYSGPQNGFVEQVYCLFPVAGPDGQAEVMLQNAAADRGVSMKFPVHQLPYFTLWKNLAALENGYVTGLEPGTGFPYTRRLEREAGRVPKLAPGETRQFTVETTIHPDSAGVRTVRERIQKTQGGIEPLIETAPPIVA